MTRVYEMGAGGNAENLEKGGCRKKIEEKSKAPPSGNPRTGHPPPDVLRKLIKDSKASRDRGLSTDEKILEESGRKNLAILLENIPATDRVRIQIRAELFN